VTPVIHQQIVSANEKISSKYPCEAVGNRQYTHSIWDLDLNPGRCGYITVTIKPVSQENSDKLGRRKKTILLKWLHKIQKQGKQYTQTA